MPTPTETKLPNGNLPLGERHIVLGVTGGVAAYKAVDLCRRLTKLGSQVTPVLTANAERFIGQATFAALAANAPITSLWDNIDPSPHTTLARNADLVVVAPATARIIASYAHGLSDDVLATTLIATEKPVVMCPAMHTEMWNNPAVRANIETLRSRGVRIVEPEHGLLAGGDVGVGRLASLDSITAAVADQLTQQDLRKHRILVTAGGTREPLDPVRFIGNRSSGRQGHSIAEVARRRGANVTLITAAAIPAPHGIKTVRVNTAGEMHDAVVDQLGDVDVLIMAAAVADFQPAHQSQQKLKKDDGNPAIDLVPTQDILTSVAERRRPDQIIVGFAAETQNLRANALDKLHRKQLDLIVANDVSDPTSGFETSVNNVLILDKFGREYATGPVEKPTVAAALLDRVASLIANRADDN